MSWWKSLRLPSSRHGSKGTAFGVIRRATLDLPIAGRLARFSPFDSHDTHAADGYSRRKGLMMPKAVWNGQVIAESSDTVVVEGNHYFPPDSLRKECFQDSATTSVCGWKGTANYYDVVVEDQTNSDAAWYYADPKSKAETIRGYVAFWKGVSVEDSGDGQTPASGNSDLGHGETC